MIEVGLEYDLDTPIDIGAFATKDCPDRPSGISLGTIDDKKDKDVSSYFANLSLADLCQLHKKGYSSLAIRIRTEKPI